MTPSFSWPTGIRAALTISFDDARTSQADCGLSILDAHGLKSTFYVSFPSLEQRLDAWRAASKNGHEIGNHTVHHPCGGNYPFARAHALEEYTLQQMDEELLGANARISDLLGVSAQTFAYPCGQKFVGRGEGVQSYVPLVARRFIAGRSYKEQSANDPEFCDLAQLYAIDGDVADADGIMEHLETTIAHGGWLILGAHEVAKGHGQRMAPQVLETLCRFARERRDILWTGTVAEIAGHVRMQRSAVAPQRASQSAS